MLERDYTSRLGGLVRRDGAVEPLHSRSEQMPLEAAGHQGSGQVDRIQEVSTSFEQEVHAYREKLRRTERLAALGPLSVTLADELTQPLTVIRMATQNAIAALRNSDCPKEGTGDLEMSLEAFSQIETALRRVRSFASKTLRAEKTEVHLDQCVSEIAQRLTRAADEANITFCWDGLDGLPPITASESDIRQLLLALAQNAIEAADGQEPHRLSINGVETDDGVAVRFEDDCGGIAPADVPRVFSPFFTTKPMGEGTGFGLPIAQRIAGEYGGRITVESQYGRGATFTVTLPGKASNRSR